MDIEIIVGSEFGPQHVAEIAVAAEQAGVRALWHSNFPNDWDPFIGLVPAALATSKIRLGPLAVSPYEMHPVRIANATASLNELSNGRAMVGIGGGGAVALTVRGGTGGASLDFKDMRIVRGVREAAEIVYRLTSGVAGRGYKGELFQVSRPYHLKFTKAPRPRIYTCSMGPQMLRMGGRIADAVQVGDVTPGRIGEVVAEINKGLDKRAYPADDFRIGNFWAWHIKQDREQSLWEARSQLFARAEVIAPNIGLDHLVVDGVISADEAQLVRDNFRSFIMAYLDGSGEIKGIPADLVQRLIDEVSSSGDFDDIDREIERYREFERAGQTDLALRVFGDPLEAVKTIGERVVPAFR
jgi:5,10-methylenetetrahydromethanopterin reductase